jgi:recombination protein RecA
MADDKQRALDLALKSIEKNFGKGSVMKLGEKAAIGTMEVISTSSLSLDMALGVGGVPRGRIVEIYGRNLQGKQPWRCILLRRLKKTAALRRLLMRSMRLTLSMRRHWGVDINELIVSQPDTGEQALEIAEALVRSNAIDVIV